MMGIAGSIILLSCTYFALKDFRKPKLYPLKEVLWVYDAQSNYCAPTSSLVTNYCNLLRNNGIDVDTPKHEPYVLIRANIKDEMDDRVPILILNWNPRLLKKKQL